MRSRDLARARDPTFSPLLSCYHPWMDATPTASSPLRILVVCHRCQALVALTLGRGTTHKSHSRRHPSRNRPIGVFTFPLCAATNFREEERGKVEEVKEEEKRREEELRREDKDACGGRRRVQPCYGTIFIAPTLRR
jgi:hypothetical protein